MPLFFIFHSTTTTIQSQFLDYHSSSGNYFQTCVDYTFFWDLRYYVKKTGTFPFFVTYRAHPFDLHYYINLWLFIFTVSSTTPGNFLAFDTHTWLSPLTVSFTRYHSLTYYTGVPSLPLTCECNFTNSFVLLPSSWLLEEMCVHFVS